MSLPIRLAGVSKRYGAVEALAPTSVEFAAGQAAALIGPSGCGKSTLLRLVAGLVESDGGEVRIGDAPMRPETALELRREMGYVIQEGGLFPHLTARQNATLLARHLNRPESEIVARLEELCELTRLPMDALARYPVELSGGQRQRVSLMRALFLDPEILLLDEPLGALDAMVRASLQQDLKEIFQKLGKTALLVTHDLAEAAYLADRMLLMREGRIVQDGTYEELRERPAEPFVSEFLDAQRSLVAL
jgi:osmoprotectant transport system ATP-binding protein